MLQVRKKTWLLDQLLVDRVRRIYRTKTETEAVTRALQDVVVREQIKKAFRLSAGRIPRIERVF
jgi:Arc/MetJ family transcription regulator